LNQLNNDAMHRFGKGDYHGAQESFEQALTLKPEDGNLLFNIGQCLERQGDLAHAEKWYRQCLEKSANQGDCRHALAALRFRTGRRPEAEKMVRDWLAEAPQLAGPFAESGWLLRQDKAYPQARAQLQQALNIDPHCIRALIELGVLYEDMNMPERSLVLYERALALNPQNTDISERLETLREKNVGRPKPD
jgi:Tfp pilus assembly protein PilF